jgi:hypothetical protein
MGSGGEGVGNLWIFGLKMRFFGNVWREVWQPLDFELKTGVGVAAVIPIALAYYPPSR